MSLFTSGYKPEQTDVSRSDRECEFKSTISEFVKTIAQYELRASLSKISIKILITLCKDYVYIASHDISRFMLDRFENILIGIQMYKNTY